MRILKILIGVIIFQSNVAAAQNFRTVDSLNSQLPLSPLYCQREIYHKLALEWIDWDNQRSLVLTKKEHAIAVGLQDSMNVNGSLLLMGIVLSRLERYDSAMKVLTQVITYAKRNALSNDLIYAYQALGRIYLRLGKYDVCLKLYQECLSNPEIEKELDVKKTIIYNTGLAYYKMEDIDRALEYYFKALVMMRAMKSTAEVDQLLINIGLCYIQKLDFGRGEFYLKQGQEECGSECSERIKMHIQLAEGILYVKQHKFTHAENRLRGSMRIARQLNDNRILLDNIDLLSQIYLDRNDLKRAKDVLGIADLILPEVSFNFEKRRIYGQLVKLYQASGDVTGEVVNQRMYVALTDSLFARRLAVNLMRLEADLHRREAAIKLKNGEEVIGLKNSLIESQRLVILSIGAAFILLVFFLVNMFRQNKKRRSANEILEQMIKERTAALLKTNTELKYALAQTNLETDRKLALFRKTTTSIVALCTMALNEEEKVDYLHQILSTIDQGSANS